MRTLLLTVILALMLSYTPACTPYSLNSEKERRWEEHNRDTANPWEHFAEERQKNNPRLKKKIKKVKKDTRRAPWERPPNNLDDWYWQNLGADTQRFYIGWTAVGCYDWNWFVPVMRPVRGTMQHAYKTLEDGTRYTAVVKVLRFNCENDTRSTSKKIALYYEGKLVRILEGPGVKTTIVRDGTVAERIQKAVCNKTCKGSYADRY